VIPGRSASTSSSPTGSAPRTSSAGRRRPRCFTPAAVQGGGSPGPSGGGGREPRHYLGLLHRAECELAEAFDEIGDGHADEVDIQSLCHRLARQCESHAERLQLFVGRYGEDAEEEPERLHSTLFQGARDGGLGLLRDLHDLYLMACETEIAWTLVAQAAQGARDRELLEVVQACESETATQANWLRTRMKQAAPQALVVSE
jgi:hypothetical protein